ncbi:MAG TPA: GGDEF domain-containing protein [Marinobacter sp.]|uniref:GGDEF domain-containing protein n=1 Tax=Marinobacter sp. TaxID=50741 RepID=UPI002D80428C|nr:GGDEF domain-containing protein [Marinobacter sp.]HET8800886.1 GGDEF domain-containing protein [Marinobacter sp.]
MTVIDEDAGWQRVLFSINSGTLALNEGLTVPWSDTLCKRSLSENRWYTDDVQGEWGDSDAARVLGLQTYVSVPVEQLEGGLFGTLCGASTSRVPVDESVRDVLSLCARLISSQLSRERASAMAEQRAERAEVQLESLAMLSAIGDLCFEADSLDSALDRVARLLCSRGGWRLAIPFHVQDRCRPIDDRYNPFVSLMELADRTMPLASGGHHPFPFIVCSLGDYLDDRALREWSLAEEPDAMTVAMTSIETGDGRVGGLLLIGTCGADELETEARLISGYSNYFSLLAERSGYLEQLEKANEELLVHAMHDPLTGLANRRYLVEELSRMLSTCQRNGGLVYVAFLDLDGFKAVNDTHGHDTGDEFLQAIAENLRRAARSGDLVSRQGGDEFVVISMASGPTDHQGLDAFLDRLRTATIGEFQLSELTMGYAGASVGGVVSEPGEKDPDTLLARADEAMYDIKRARRLAKPQPGRVPGHG